MPKNDELPIIQHTYDLILWLAAAGDQRLGALPTLPDGKSPIDTFVA